MKRYLPILMLLIVLLGFSCKKDKPAETGFSIKASSKGEFTVEASVYRFNTEGGEAFPETIERIAQSVKNGQYEFKSDKVKKGDAYDVRIEGEKGQTVQLEVKFNNQNSTIRYYTHEEYPIANANGQF